ncbi:hypothetical protein B0H12DRAFT_330206 [Mycena haematopus]|nr:hypothetical protein B0H12DRAFT_330206 [Mycena haematopus]
MTDRFYSFDVAFDARRRGKLTQECKFSKRVQLSRRAATHAQVRRWRGVLAVQVVVSVIRNRNESNLTGETDSSQFMEAEDMVSIYRALFWLRYRICLGLSLWYLLAPICVSSAAGARIAHLLILRAPGSGWVIHVYRVDGVLSPQSLFPDNFGKLSVPSLYYHTTSNLSRLILAPLFTRRSTENKRRRAALHVLQRIFDTGSSLASSFEVVSSSISIFNGQRTGAYARLIDGRCLQSTH